MVGSVFLSEGIQKFLFRETNGSGRFKKIGQSLSEFSGNFVGTFEILCEALIVFGLLTRPANIPPIIIMLAAAATAKSEVLNQKGFWEMMRGSITDWSMLLGSILYRLKAQGMSRWTIFNEKNLGLLLC